MRPEKAGADKARQSQTALDMATFMITGEEDQIMDGDEGAAQPSLQRQCMQARRCCLLHSALSAAAEKSIARSETEG